MTQYNQIVYFEVLPKGQMAGPLYASEKFISENKS